MDEAWRIRLAGISEFADVFELGIVFAQSQNGPEKPERSDEQIQAVAELVAKSPVLNKAQGDQLIYVAARTSMDKDAALDKLAEKMAAGSI